jgi:ferredoxin--NADP+ reductase
MLAMNTPSDPPPTREYNAVLVRRLDVTPTLARFWFRPTEEVAFEPGQYVPLGLRLAERMVIRPFSIASDREQAQSDGLEFFVRLVPGGQLTSALWAMDIGDQIHVGPSKGRLRLPVSDIPTLCVASGTGIAPFVSMARTRRTLGRPRSMIVLQGSSRVEDLAYRDELEAMSRDTAHTGLRYIPTISRPQPAADGWTGRTGRVESIISDVWREVGFNQSRSIGLVCGNSEMAKAVEALLLGHGLDPERLTKEFATIVRPPAPHGPTGGAAAVRSQA